MLLRPVSNSIVGLLGSNGLGITVVNYKSGLAYKTATFIIAVSLLSLRCCNIILVDLPKRIQFDSGILCSNMYP